MHDCVFSLFGKALHNVAEIPIKNSLWVSKTACNLLSEVWTQEIVLHTHKMFVGPLEARKITFVVSYNHGYRRMRGVWRRMQICMHIWGYIFWLSWQCSNWRRSVASSRMNLTQISFRFVFDWKTHSQAFRKHLKHLKLKFWARKYAYANFCGNMPKGVWRRMKKRM